MLSSVNVQNVNAESLQANTGSVVNLTATTLNNMNVADLFNKRNIPSYADVDAARAALSEGDIYSLDGEDTLRVLREADFYTGFSDTFDASLASPPWTLAFLFGNAAQPHTATVSGGKLEVVKTVGTDVCIQTLYPAGKALEVGMEISVEVEHVDSPTTAEMGLWVGNSDSAGLTDCFTFISQPVFSARVTYKDAGGTNRLNTTFGVLNTTAPNKLAIRRTAEAVYEFYVNDVLRQTYTVTEPVKPGLVAGLYLGSQIVDPYTVEFDNFNLKEY